ncbi:calcium-binding and coiled-coil domain-containing protein 2 [Mastacembelus armatus]|uniref:Calcium binding and coiled-coil domain 2 n=1 Tax=Mastacembelus armatus TaxID=205130 RepID=A0A3Q3L894_9TELE|nr:calcium-binding and coiled-coil domain-containing protein 2 [Mastacembelus armatus]XP_026171327.1 calcium-binding and coiled-coil domain-containing protein 2 [Mastacembelus armatus]
MESPSEEAAAESFSQVVFLDIPHSYPLSTHVTCYYTLASAYQPDPRDWVGIFKVGWSSTKDYHTFVWVEHSLDVVGQESVTRQAVFKDYYLPKDEIEFYQFCYVDNAGQVRGASTPFCFKRPVEQSMESSPDDDLLVITTQEQVEQSVREKAELQKELDQMREENEALKRALQEDQQNVANLKGQNEQKEKEKTQLVQELDQVTEQNRNLTSTLEQQQQEMNNLKDEILVQKTKQMEMQQQLSAAERKNQIDGSSLSEEKYNRALQKINQLQEDRVKLRATIDDQVDEINKLNSKLRELDRELLITRDSIHLVQVDLQSCEKEKEKVSAELQMLTRNLDEVKREKQALCRRLSQQEPSQDSPDEDLKVQYRTVVSQLHDAQAKLAAEKDESKKAKKQAEMLENQVQHIKKQMDTVVTSWEQEQRKSSKYELQLREAHEAIAEKDSIIEDSEQTLRFLRHEKEELVRQKQNLASDIEGLRKAYAELQAASPADATSTNPEQTQTPEQSENLYENIGSGAEAEEELLVCRHCQESFPSITRNELEQHEQSHRMCPFCAMICDNMEQSVFEDHVYSHEL